MLDSDEDVRTFTIWRNGRELSRAWMMRDRGRYPELGEVVERLLRMSLRGAEKVTAEREDESFDRWYLPRALTASPNAPIEPRAAGTSFPESPGASAPIGC